MAKNRRIEGASGREYKTHIFSKVFYDETFDQKTLFMLQNTLKLAYSKVETHNFSGGNTPAPPLQGRGGERRGGGNSVPLFEPFRRLWL